MPTANELLNSLIAPEVLVINPNTRKITIPSSITTLGVESDDDVLRLNFEVPQIYCDEDLSEYEFRINYMNAKNEGDVYVVDDVSIQDKVVSFSWLVGRTALIYKGNVSFIVCMKKVRADGVVLNELNTTTASLPVLEGLETGAQVVQEYPDALETMLLRLDVQDERIGGIEEAVNDVNIALERIVEIQNELIGGGE